MTVLLIDANNLGWMAYNRVPLTHNDERTEVIFLGLGMVKNYLAQFDPDYCVVVWDGGRDKRRTSIYPDYKRRKKEPTEEELEDRQAFFEQVGKLQECLKALGVTQYRVKGREADDVIASGVNLLDPMTEWFTVVSTDKDFYQLTANRKVAIYNPIKKKIINADYVEWETEVPAKHYVEYKAMVGDPSDNLPGVKGIGPVGAEWLTKVVCYEEEKVEELLRYMKPQEEKALSLLENNSKQFELMMDLVKFKDIDKEELEAGRIEDRPTSLAELQERAMVICEMYGFEKYLESFQYFIQPFEQLWLKRRKDDRS